MTAGRFDTTMQLAAALPGGGVPALRALCEHLGLPFYERVPAASLPQAVAEKLDVGWARRNRLVPVAADDERVLVATSAPLALEAFDELALVLGRRVDVAGAPEEEVLRTLNLLFTESMDTADDVLREIQAEEEGGLDDLDAVLDLLDSTDAARSSGWSTASSTRPSPNGPATSTSNRPPDLVKIRFRIDGVLYDRLARPKAICPFFPPGSKSWPAWTSPNAACPRTGASISPSAKKHRRPRLGHPHVRRGTNGPAPAGQGHGPLSLDDLGMEPGSLENLRPPHHPAPRHLPVHRPHRQRQDHHSVHGPQPAQHQRTEHHHHRRPGRIPFARSGPDSRQHQGGPQLRPRPPVGAAPRPGRDHDR